MSPILPLSHSLFVPIEGMIKREEEKGGERGRRDEEKGRGEGTRRRKRRWDEEK